MFEKKKHDRLNDVKKQLLSLSRRSSFHINAKKPHFLFQVFKVGHINLDWKYWTDIYLLHFMWKLTMPVHCCNTSPVTSLDGGKTAHMQPPPSSVKC